MAKRNIEKYIDSKFLDKGCLLCSEHEPHFCHRRLVIEYLQKYDESISVNHLIKAPKK